MAFGSINYSKLVYHPKVYYPEDPPRLDGWKARRLAGEKVGRSDGWKVGRISRNFVSAPVVTDTSRIQRILEFLLFPDTFGKCWKVGRLND